MLGKHLNPCEDSLTASVFTHLLHLPSEVFWSILRNACFTESLPKHAGEPIEVEPWPKWDATGTMTNSTYVEPDVFIRFPAFDLIVEAKRRDDGQQYRQQWERELIGYSNTYGETQSEVRMIALGGIWQTSDSEVVAPPSAGRAEVRCPVHMCKWGHLLTECQKMLNEVSRLKYATSQTIAHKRVLADLIDLFAWHGFQTGIWLAEVADRLPQLTSEMPSHHQTLQSIKYETNP